MEDAGRVLCNTIVFCVTFLFDSDALEIFVEAVCGIWVAFKFAEKTLGKIWSFVWEIGKDRVFEDSTWEFKLYGVVDTIPLDVFISMITDIKSVWSMLEDLL